MTEDQALAVLTLWASGHFSTAAIGRLLHIHEAEVARAITRDRDLQRQKGLVA